MRNSHNTPHTPRGVSTSSVEVSVFSEEEKTGLKKVFSRTEPFETSRYVLARVDGMRRKPFDDMTFEDIQERASGGMEYLDFLPW